MMMMMKTGSHLEVMNLQNPWYYALFQAMRSGRKTVGQNRLEYMKQVHNSRGFSDCIHLTAVSEIFCNEN